MPNDWDGAPIAVEKALDDYDLLPYPSMPYAHTQPARMAAIATLHGLAAPDAARARVLELGCASGGNVIPLAARFPNASFLGVDLARRHVEQAQLRVTELGLTNIEVRQGDLARLQFDGDSFDYIICHGVFSWAPPAAQDGILRICRDRLSPSGVACVSYNVLPGWHLRTVIRDICLRHAGSTAPPHERVARARAIITALAATASEANTYGLLLRKEAQRLSRRPASYILGELLVEHNTPAFFTDFAARAASHGLAYLDDAELEAAVPEILNTHVQTQIAAMAGSDPITTQQYIDYFSGRMLRSSLLVGADAKTQPTRDFARLQELHLCGHLEIDSRRPGAMSFKDAQGRSIKSEHPAVHGALAHLADAHPETRTIEQLAGETSGDQSVQDVTRAMSLLIATGQIEISTLPFRVGHADDICPRVWDIARAEASTRQPWITNLAHKPVPLKPAMLVLMPHLNGVNDRDMLVSVMSDALDEGALEVPELQACTRARHDTARVASIYVERTIDYLAGNALLVSSDWPS